MALPGHSSSVDGCNSAGAQCLDVLGSPVLGSVTNNQHVNLLMVVKGVLSCWYLGHCKELSV